MATRAASDRPRLPKKYFRRANCIISYWRHREFVIENYLLGTELACHPLLQSWIHKVESRNTLDQLRRSAASVGFPNAIVGDLVRAGIFLSIGSHVDRKDKAIGGWVWGANARYFHFSTQEVEYTFDHAAIRKTFEKKAASNPPPSPFKSYRRKSLALPVPRKLTRDFLEILSTRRTCRNFKRSPIALETLSTLLKWTFGMTRYYNESRLDRRIMRTSPSGGARHPIEVYLVAQQVEGLRCGVYHYSVKKHALTPLRSGSVPNIATRLFCGQSWVSDASVAFLMTAVLPRSMWKYEHSRAYRVVFLDAGHLGQTLHLMGTALGLGVFTTAAIADRKVETLLRIDGVNEVALYAGAVGCASRVAHDAKF